MHKNYKRILTSLLTVLILASILPLTQITASAPADIAYIVESSAGTDTSLLSEISSLGYTYDVIYETNVPLTDLSGYLLVIIGDDNLDDPESFPIHKHKTLVINSYDYYTKTGNDQLGLSGGKSATTNSELKTANTNHRILEGMPEKFDAYLSSKLIFILKGQKPTGVDILAYRTFSSNAVVASFEEGTTLLNGKVLEKKAVYFGIPDARYWSTTTEQLFANSVQWLIGEDNDTDGFFTPEDCDDTDPTINPANPDLTKNCLNDEPTINSISDITVEESDLITIEVTAQDPEQDSLTYNINSQDFSINGNILTWQTNYQDAGDYTFTVEVSDGELTAETTVDIEITNKNQPPILQPIPDQEWDEDTITELDLKDYFTDSDQDDLEFGIEETSLDNHIAILLQGEGVYEFTVEEDWNGQDWIVFYATDGTSKTISNEITLTVLPINDPVELTESIPDIIINEDEDAEDAIDLNDYFEDIEGDALEFFISSVNDIQVEINAGLVSFYPDLDYSGTQEIYFVASDSQTQTESNTLILEVVERGELPVLSELTCDTELTEDEEYDCTLEASDIDNNPLTFSASSNNNLNCEVSGNKLHYYPIENYNGGASCDVIVSDKDGSHSRTLEVDVAPVNDAPEIISIDPDQSIVNIIQGKSKTFTINAEDIDSDITIEWKLGTQQTSTTSRTFNFQESEKGYYSVQALVSDEESTISKFWNVLVNPLSSFTCSEASGYTCNENQLCGGEILDVKDTDSCCAVQCMPKFDDVNSCDAIDSDLDLEIKHPDPDDEDDKVEIGDKIDVEIQIENDYEEDQNFDVEIHLYDLDTDKSVEEVTTNVE
ncbi:MAG: tandem-95 repeat protein, partial [Candidatus Thorarchaeota archaeon]